MVLVPPLLVVHLFSEPIVRRLSELEFAATRILEIDSVAMANATIDGLNVDADP